MGYHWRHLPHLLALFPGKLHARKEKDSQGPTTASISPSMAGHQVLKAVANEALSGSSHAANGHNFNRRLKTISRSIVHKTDMQCMAMHLPLQVCLPDRFIERGCSNLSCPPAYNPDGDSVPAYSPPEGASKVKPVLNYAEIPPPGPPPSHSEGGPSQKAPEVVITPPAATSSSYPQ